MFSEVQKSTMGEGEQTLSVRGQTGRIGLCFRASRHDRLSYSTAKGGRRTCFLKMGKAEGS